MSYYSTFNTMLNEAIKSKAENLPLLSILNTNIVTTNVGGSSGSLQTGQYTDSNVVSVIRAYVLELQALKMNVNKAYSDTIIDNTISQLQSIIPSPPTINQINYALQTFYKSNKKDYTTYALAQNYLSNSFGASLDKTIADSLIKAYIKS